MQFTGWLSQRHALLAKTEQRCLIILQGTEAWFENQVIEFKEKTIKGTAGNSVLTYSEHPCFPSDVNRKTYTHQLGTESDLLIFMDSSLNIDALNALAGTIKRGGMCLLWLPSSTTCSLFTRRFMNAVKMSDQHYLLTQDQPEPPLLAFDEQAYKANSLPLAVSAQKKTVDRIVNAVLEKGHEPVVLTADRGRGKSATLAKACAVLLCQQQDVSLVVTAPSRASLNVFFDWLVLSLDELSGNANITWTKDKRGFQVAGNTLLYLPIDQALAQGDKKHCLVVDEAAGVPVYQLQRLLSLYQQSVFSSTIYGYEGAGKGFSLKFLSSLASGYLALHLEHPIRWNHGDRLEKLLFDTCLLNAELNGTLPEVKSQFESQLQVVQLEQAELAQNNYLLSQVFSVLVTAHYQTKPSDLKMMLDNPQVKVFVISHKESIVATALTLVEETIDTALVEAIKQGKRRVKDHFLPQAILTQCRDEQAFNYQYLRVMRIAVHPSYQRQGLGTRLLSFITKWAEENHIDCLGTSYAANPDTTLFWLEQGLAPICLSYKADSASGEHSLLMLKSLGKNSENYCHQLAESFYRDFPMLLAAEYRHLSVPLVQLLLSKPKMQLTNHPQFLLNDIKNVEEFAQGYTQLGYIIPSMTRWLLSRLYIGDIQQDVQCRPLIAKVLMKKDDAWLGEQYGFTGRKDVAQKLSRIVSALLVH